MYFFHHSSMITFKSSFIRSPIGRSRNNSTEIVCGSLYGLVRETPQENYWDCKREVKAYQELMEDSLDICYYRASHSSKFHEILTNLRWVAWIDWPQNVEQYQIIQRINQNIITTRMQFRIRKPIPIFTKFNYNSKKHIADPSLSSNSFSNYDENHKILRNTHNS